MARTLLWLFVVVGFVTVLVDGIKGDSIDISTKIFILSSLSVLAICESITEKGKN